MLILTRKPGERLYIGDSVKVTVVEIKGNQIRLGIEAPSDLRIYREEIYLQILEENKRASEALRGLTKELEGLSVGWAGGDSGDDADSGKNPKQKGLSSLKTATKSTTPPNPNKKRSPEGN